MRDRLAWMAYPCQREIVFGNQARQPDDRESHNNLDSSRRRTTVHRDWNGIKGEGQYVSRACGNMAPNGASEVVIFVTLQESALAGGYKGDTGSSSMTRNGRINSNPCPLPRER